MKLEAPDKFKPPEGDQIVRSTVLFWLRPVAVFFNERSDENTIANGLQRQTA